MKKCLLCNKSVTHTGISANNVSLFHCECQFGIKNQQYYFCMMHYGWKEEKMFCWDTTVFSSLNTDYVFDIHNNNWNNYYIIRHRKYGQILKSIKVDGIIDLTLENICRVLETYRLLQ